MEKQMKVCIITLGCKVNEYESLSMTSQLIQAGYSVTNKLEVADIYIINSCAVTNMAERKSRQMIAKVRKLNENAKIIIAGCASEHNSEQFKAYPNVYSIIGNAEKNNIVKYLETSILDKPINLSCEYTNLPYASKSKARQYIKIQDGCNNFCSYCIIPYTRGRSRSRDMQDILTEIKQTTTNEIVLTGINVSDYKQNGKLALIDLLEEVDKLNIRFRLSSIECVVMLDDDFLNRLAKLKNFCPFFHLSLQSACNQTLKRMNRHYTIEEYIDICYKIKKIFPSACISTDIIVGFKGETDEEFETTIENIAKTPFSFMHIFPYSVRKGTNAEKLGGDVVTSVIKAREKRLALYNKKIKERFIKENLKLKHKVLVEEFDGEYSLGYTENYIYCYIPKKLKEGKIVTVTGVQPYKNGMIAKIVK